MSMASVPGRGGGSGGEPAAVQPVMRDIAALYAAFPEDEAGARRRDRIDTPPCGALQARGQSHTF